MKNADSFHPGFSDQRIAEVRIHRLRAQLQERFGWSLNWTRTRETTLVEVVLTDGQTGWGEGACPPAVLDGCKDKVIGRSPFEIEGIWETLRSPAGHQQRPGPPACPGLDIALWDAAGKLLRLPVSSLFGQRRRSEVQVYCTALYRKDWPDWKTGLVGEALLWKKRGFRAMKMKIGFSPETDVQLTAAVREAIGPNIGLAVDSNCAYDGGTALRLGKRLEAFDLLWWEEPVVASDFSGYERLKQQLGIPLAGGETESADWLIRNYVLPGRVDILQPDLEHIGLTGARTLTNLCWLQGLRLIPHNWGSAIRTAASLHWMSTMPALTPALNPPPAMLEFDQTESPYRDSILKERIQWNPDTGSLAVPTGPGLGVTVDPDAVEEFRSELFICR